MVLPLILGALGSAAAGASLISMSPWLAGAIGSGLGTFIQGGGDKDALKQGIFTGLTGAALGYAGNSLFGNVAAKAPTTPFANAVDPSKVAPANMPYGTTAPLSAPLAPVKDMSVFKGGPGLAPSLNPTQTAGYPEFPLNAVGIGDKLNQAQDMGLWNTAKYGFNEGTMKPGGIGAMMGSMVAPMVFPSAFAEKTKSGSKEEKEYPQAQPLNRQVVPPPPGYNPGHDPEHVYFNPTNPYYASGGGLLPVRMRAGGLANIRRMADGGEVAVGNSTKGGRRVMRPEGWEPEYPKLANFYDAMGAIGGLAGANIPSAYELYQRRQQATAGNSTTGGGSPTTPPPTTPPPTTPPPPAAYQPVPYQPVNNPNVTALRERLGITGPTYGSVMNPIRQDTFNATQQALANRFGGAGVPPAAPPAAPPATVPNFWGGRDGAYKAEHSPEPERTRYVFGGDRSDWPDIYRREGNDADRNSPDFGDRGGRDISNDAEQGFGGPDFGGTGVYASGGIVRLAPGGMVPPAAPATPVPGGIGDMMPPTAAPAQAAPLPEMGPPAEGANPQMQQMVAAMQNMDRASLGELLARAVRGELPQQIAELAMAVYVSRYGKEEAFAIANQATGKANPKAAGLVEGPGDGMSDEVPAALAQGEYVQNPGEYLEPQRMAGGGQPDVLLSDGEYVVSADVVSGLGNGSTDAGANVLDGMMANVRAARTGSPKQPGPINSRRILPA